MPLPPHTLSQTRTSRWGRGAAPAQGSRLRPRPRGRPGWPVAATSGRALTAALPPSMLIYYLQSVARSLRLSNQQLRAQIQNVSTAQPAA